MRAWLTTEESLRARDSSTGEERRQATLCPQGCQPTKIGNTIICAACRTSIYHCSLQARSLHSSKGALDRSQRACVKRAHSYRARSVSTGTNRHPSFPSKLARSLSGWGLIDLPLRASTEGLLRPRVARAQKIIRLHPPLFREHRG